MKNKEPAPQSWHELIDALSWPQRLAMAKVLTERNAQDIQWGE
jgi:hypothetical protein